MRDILKMKCIGGQKYNTPVFFFNTIKLKININNEVNNPIEAMEMSIFSNKYLTFCGNFILL